MDALSLKNITLWAMREFEIAAKNDAVSQADTLMRVKHVIDAIASSLTVGGCNGD